MARLMRVASCFFAVVALPSWVAAQAVCGTVVPKGEQLTLSEDLGPCDGVEAAVVVDGGTLDLGGHTVRCADLDGDGEVPQGAVLFGRKAQVKNGTVSGCANGVALAGAGRHLVTDVTARDSVDDGFDVLPGADGCRLVQSTALQNGDDGVQIRSDRNALESIATSGNRDDGVDLWRTGRGNVLIAIRADENGDEGLLVSGSGNRLREPAAHGNGTVGIDLNGVGNSLSGGTAGGNGVYDLVRCAGDRVKRVAVGTTTRDCRRVSGAGRGR